MRAPTLWSGLCQILGLAILHGMDRGGAVRTSLPVREYARFFADLVFCTALLSLLAFLAAVEQPEPGFIPVWPSSGVGLALLWRHGARYWPAVFVSNTISSMA